MYPDARILLVLRDPFEHAASLHRQHLNFAGQQQADDADDEASLQKKHVAAKAQPEQFAAREAVIREGEARFVIAGHTHRPRIELLANEDPIVEQYYIVQ